MFSQDRIVSAVIMLALTIAMSFFNVKLQDSDALVQAMVDASVHVAGCGK